MKFTLAAAALPALAMASPACKPTCNSLSNNPPPFTVSGFTYQGSYTFTTPAHQNANGFIQFNVTNPITTETVDCNASSSVLSSFFHGTTWYTCTDGVTKFKYSQPTGTIDLEVPWTCQPKNGGGEKSWTGTGTSVFELECEEDVYQNDDWQSGEIYSSRVVKCSAPDTAVEMTTSHTTA